MVAYIKPQQRKKEKSERPREERDQIKFIDLRFGSSYPSRSIRTHGDTSILF